MIEPGKTWALSRRTTRRYFLLNPDHAREIERCYWYCLGLAAQRFGVVVHAGCLMSTHSHEVVTDVQGVLPRFLQEFHRLLALTTKAHRGWPGEVFDKRSTGQHELLTPEAAIEALGYLIANPVEAGAVRYARDWPGAHTVPRDIGSRVVKVERPTLYFDSDNPNWPDTIELRLEMPTSLELDYGIELAQQRIADRVKEREHRAWQESKRTGIAFVGARRVVQQTHTKRARSDEAFGSLNPQFAAAGIRAQPPKRCADCVRSTRSATKRLRQTTRLVILLRAVAAAKRTGAPRSSSSPDCGRILAQNRPTSVIRDANTQLVVLADRDDIA